MSWENYFEKNKNRSLRLFYLQAISFADDLIAPKENSKALDLGCGTGHESADLMKRGWKTVAVDHEIGAIKNTQTRALAALQELNPALDLPSLELALASKMEFIHLPFEQLQELPSSDFIYAFHSLPFCDPNHFDHVWNLIKTSLNPGGVFAGSFFGNRDQWAKDQSVVGVSEEKIKAMFHELKILHFEEHEENGPTALNGEKHWHTMDIIAQS